MKKKLHFKHCWPYIIILGFLSSCVVTFGFGCRMLLANPEQYDFLSKVLYQNGNFVFTNWHLLLVILFSFCSILLSCICALIYSWCLKQITKSIY